MKAAVVALSITLALCTLSKALAASDPAVNAELRNGRKVGASGEPRQALPHFQKALDLATAKSEGSLDQAEALMELGECYREAGQSDKGMPLLSKAIGIAEKVDGGSEILVAALANLALLDSDAGRCQDSLKCYKRCLAEIGKMPHPDIATQAKLENNMGLLMAKSNLDEQAIKMYERALTRSANDSSMAGLHISCLGNIAMSYRALKNLAKAEEYASNAVKEAKQAMPIDDPDYGFALAQQGMILVDDHKYEEARIALSEAIAVLGKALGDDHPQVAQVKISYAECMAALKKNPAPDR